MDKSSTRKDVHYLRVTCHSATWDYKLMTSQHPSAHPLRRALLALGAASKRVEVSPPPQSVRASVDGCQASPCTHARSEVADRAWDLLGVRQHPGLQKESPSLFSTCCFPFYSKFCRWNEGTDTLPSCLGLQRMWPKSRRTPTRWVEPGGLYGNIGTWQEL